MIRYWEEDTETEIGRPFDLEKHDKEISDKWINKVKKTREGIQKLVDMCGSDTVADLNIKSGLGHQAGILGNSIAEMKAL